MSKYTTEVRFICEQLAGLNNSVGFSSVDSVIDQAWQSIFTTNQDVFNGYKEVICKKILKHYYTREIGYETVGLWKLKLNTRFEEIIPYYNNIYRVTAMEFNPLYDVDVTDTTNKTGTTNDTGKTTGSRDHTRTDDLSTLRTDDLQDTRTDNLKDERTDDLTQIQNNNLTDTSSATGNSTNFDAYQDTPQGSLNMVTDLNYLTNIRKVTNDQTGNTTTTSTGDVTTDHTGTQTTEHTGDQIVNHDGTQKHDYTGTQKNNETYEDNKTNNINSTEDYVNHIIGKRGTMTYSAMVEEYITKLKNVDMMVINEFKDLFMNLW